MIWRTMYVQLINNSIYQGCFPLRLETIVPFQCYAFGECRPALGEDDQVPWELEWLCESTCSRFGPLWGFEGNCVCAHFAGRGSRGLKREVALYNSNSRLDYDFFR